MNPLNHVAIIMDGNGRWGLKHKNSRNEGHKAGINTVEKIIKETIKHNIKFLTLYAFSTENWKRPQKEINYLFNLLETFLNNKINDLNKQNIKLKIIGEKNFSPKLINLFNLNVNLRFPIILNFIFFSCNSSILFDKKVSSKLNKYFISFFGLFQFSVENA